MRVNDVVIGSILLVVSVSAAILASDFPSVPSRNFGAWTFPTVVACLLAASSAFLAIQGLITKTEPRRNSRPSRRAVINVLLVCLSPLFYVAVVPLAGFIPGVIAVIGTITYRLWGGMWRSATLAIVATLAVDMTFRGLLGVPLPEGLVTWTPW